MKKLLFATALVASAAAFADAPTAINAISFEGYTAGVGLGSNGTYEQNESGGTDKGKAYFCYDGDQDGSTIKAFGNGDGEVPAPSITRPAYFAAQELTNLNYLDLSTEGGILWRSIDQVTGSGANCELGSDQAIAADGIYLDTLVQFTPTEDGGTPELETEDKLAIWLNVDSATTPPTTNLIVRAAYVNDNGTDTSATATNFVLVTSSPVVPGTWYRLTVKAVADVTKCKAKNGEYNPNGITGFEIYLDGVQLAAATTTIGDGYIDRATDPGDYGWLDQSTDADFITYLQSGKVFPSLKGETSTDTLQGVGFKGSGALDDIVWTDQDPFANAPTPEGYSVEIGGSPVPITLSAAEVEAFGSALLAAGFTGYDLSTASGVNAALAMTIGTSGVPAWQAFFLGLPLTEAGLESFKIDSIAFDEDGKVVVTLDDDVVPLIGHGVTITLNLKGSADLSTWEQIETATITSGATNSVDFDPVTPAAGETKKFYKVTVDFTSTPVVL